MNPFLDHQQVYQRLVNDRMGPMAPLVQQSAERVLHRSGSRGEDVCLDRGQMNDVLADEPARDHETLGIDLIQAEELLREIAHCVPDIDPFFGFVDVDVADAVRLDDRKLLVFALAQVRIDHHGPVVARMDQICRVAVLFQRADDAVELPRRRRAAGEEEVPGDVDLQRGIHLFRNDVLVPGQVHHLVVVAQDGFWPGLQDSDACLGHAHNVT